MGEAPTSRTAEHPYGFNVNNPLGRADPTGEKYWTGQKILDYVANAPVVAEVVTGGHGSTCLGCMTTRQYLYPGESLAASSLACQGMGLCFTGGGGGGGGGPRRKSLHKGSGSITSGIFSTSTE